MPPLSAQEQDDEQGNNEAENGGPAIEAGNSALLTNRRAESMAVGDAWSPEALESLRKRFAKTALPSNPSEDSISP